MTLSADLSTRLAEGGRLTDREIASIAATHDIISLGILADQARRRLHGARTTFVRVGEVTAVPGEPASCPPTAGEIRIVGAVSSLKDAVARVAEVAAIVDGLPLSGFSLADLEGLAASEATTLRSLLEELRSAGLELIADAPFDLLRNPRRSIEEVNIAGLTLARLTIARSPSADVVSLLTRVAELQAQVGVMRAFAPLPRAFNPAVPATGYEDVKRVGLARLIVGNVSSIQVDWRLHGPKLAQVVLTMGADDIDNVSPREEVAEGRRRSPLEEIRRNIRAAGQEPVERNGRFDLLAR